jgi:hypothetical protein
MSILGNGNVGIGTTTPDCNLEIYGDTSSLKLTRSKNNTNYGCSVDFALLNSANEKFTYGRVSGSIADNTNGSEDGLLSFQVGTNGSMGNSYQQEKMRILSNGNVGIGTQSPHSKLDVRGVGNITSGDGYAAVNGYMQAGSLNIGSVSLDYGGGNSWTTNTAGLMFECANNTEIAVHDSGNRLASLIYYQGGTTNRIHIGRDMGWGTSPLFATSYIQCIGELLVTTTNGNSATGNGVSMKSNNNMRWTWAPGTDNWLRLYGDGMTGNEYGVYKSVAVGNLWSAGYTRFSSDDRVKHFEEEIPALEIINQLNPYKYKKTSKIYTEKYTGEIGEEGVDWVWEIGLIAQDIKKIPYLEFAVSNPEDGPEGKYGLNYTHFIGVCVQGIKEMDQKLQTTRTQLEGDLQTTQIELQAEKAKVAKLELLIEGITTRMTEHERQTGFRM